MTKNTHRYVSGLVFALALALVLAACGDATATNVPTAAAQPTAAPTTTATNRPATTTAPATSAPATTVAKSMNAEQLVAEIKNRVTQVQPVLLTGEVPAGFEATLSSAGSDSFKIDYVDAKNGKKLSLFTAISNPPLPGANTEQTNPAFRDVRAFYQVMDKTQPKSQRFLMWEEPGHWQMGGNTRDSVTYNLTAEGMTHEEFWQVATSLFVVIPADAPRSSAAQNDQSARAAIQQYFQNLNDKKCNAAYEVQPH